MSSDQLVNEALDELLSQDSVTADDFSITTELVPRLITPTSFVSLYCSSREESSDHSEDDHSRGNIRHNRRESILRHPRVALERLFFTEFNLEHAEGDNQRTSRTGGSGWQENVYENNDDNATSGQTCEADNEGRSFVTTIVRAIDRSTKKRGIIHEVVYFADGRRPFEFIRKCFETTSTANIFLACWHEPNHLHIVHDCSGSEKRCKCVRLCSLRRGRKPNRRFLYGSAINGEWWENILLYFASDTREYLLLEVGGKCWFRSSKIGGLQLPRRMQFRQERLVAQSSSTFDLCHSQEELPIKTSFGSTVPSSSEEIFGGSRCRKGSKEEQLLNFLKKYPCAPIKHYTNLKQFRETSFYYWNFKRHHYKRMLTRFEYFINDLTIAELKDFTNNSTPFYNAPNGNLNEYYYDREKSLHILDELLCFQARENEFSITQFLQDVYSILSKKYPKKNTMLIVGAACSGKNFFFDAIIHSQFNFGQIGNFNKYQSFPLQEAVNKRVLLWNEPDIEVGQHETLKMLLGGDTLNVKVKYEDDTILTRTPIFALCNQNPFPTSDAFRLRIIRYNWCMASLLRKYELKALPSAIWDLFSKYNIKLNVDRMEEDEDPLYTGDVEFEQIYEL
uniref:Putative nonstructural protein n=1 Tax=Cecropis daurica ambidensovirus TaxID=2794443 RepID=A0A8E7G2B9_9VIRU|nr:MAG: putative nonstructural protein [Cecropis daurica ambidensovirus]